jgi:hypothetical protein
MCNNTGGTLSPMKGARETPYEGYAVQSASFRTGVKEIVTLLVKSKTRSKAVSYTTFEGQRD